MNLPRVLIAAVLLGLAGCASPPPIVPRNIELARYMGTWRVLACMDNPVERKFVDATESYSLEGSDRIDAVFKWRDQRFSAPVRTHAFRGRVLDDPSHAVWKMKLFPLFAASYIVVDVAPDYSWAAVAHPSKKFGWVLARETRLPDRTWRRVMDRFAALGYDPSKFIRVPQPPAKN